MTDKALHETDGGGGGVSNPEVKSEKRDSGLWWVGGFMLALIILAAVLAII